MDTTFVDYTTPAVTAAWLNEVNDRIYSDVYNVKNAPFGAVGDGVTDDTAAIQAAFDALDDAQSSQVAGEQITVGAVFFPQGNYKITDTINVRGFVSIIGVGTAYTAGSVIRQTVENKNIFEFYGTSGDNSAVGCVVTGMNFEFDSSLASSNGIALYYPRLNDISGSAQATNSHYIHNNRFGGWHRKGKFIVMELCNDVEISGNVIDVLESGSAIVFGDAGTSTIECSDVRILNNNFYYSQTGISIYNGKSFVISGNSFSDHFDGSGWVSIALASNTTITAGRIDSVTISGNTFFRNYTSLQMDGSCRNIIYTDNVHRECQQSPITVSGNTDLSYVTISNNHFKVDSNYPNAFIMSIGGTGQVKNSVIKDNVVDANSVNTVTSFVNDNTTTAWLGSNNVFSNNSIVNNTANQFGSSKYIPMTSRDLVIENTKTVASFPSSEVIYNFNTLAVNDTFSFFVDYEVVVDDAGVEASVRTGTVHVAAAKMDSSIASTVTAIGSAADDTTGSGGGKLPTVTFAVANAAPSNLNVTVTSTIAADTTTIRTRAYNFRSTGTALIKNA